MSAQHIATAAVVKVSIGDPSGNTLARLVYRGGIVPEGVSEKDLERLVARGLIAEVEVIKGEEMPDAGDSSWTHDRIDEYARDHGISYDGITAKNAEKPTREEKVAHIHANTPEAVLTPADQS